MVHYNVSSNWTRYELNDDDDSQPTIKILPLLLKKEQQPTELFPNKTTQKLGIQKRTIFMHLLGIRRDQVRSLIDNYLHLYMCIDLIS